MRNSKGETWIELQRHAVRQDLVQLGAGVGGNLFDGRVALVDGRGEDGLLAGKPVHSLVISAYR